MDVEITEFDLLEHSEETLRAKLRLRLTEVVIDGFTVYAWRKNDRWFFTIPKKAGVSHVTGKKEVPFFIGSHNEKELLDKLNEELPYFVNKHSIDEE